MDLQAVRARRAAACRRPLRPFEPIHLSAARWSPGFLKGVDQALKRGWSLGAGPARSLVPPVVWDGVGRSADTHWHAWWPLDRLFNAHALTGEDRYVAPARAYVMDWLDRFQAPLLALPQAEAVQAALATSDTQAWYDMSVGLRLHRLAYLADVAARDDAWSDADLGRLFEAIDFHHRLLSDERLFQAHNNHGVFQALGQLAAAVRLPEGPCAPAARTLASDRLAACLAEHFFASGPHKEHSPGYHLTLVDTLVTARDHGLLADLDPVWLARAEEALGWMITPQGGLAPLGDTDRTAGARPPAYAERFLDPGVRAAWLGEGRAPQGLKAYADAGYLFARAGEGAEADYLAQQAGFHSRMHKHADHLGFVWHADGVEILADPGRYAYAGKSAQGSALWRDGFWYDDPARVHVEQSASHNVVTVDGRNHDRRGEPFGSALVGWGEAGGLIWSEAEVGLASGVTWRRVLVRGAHRFLLVADRLIATGGTDRQFRQHFTLGPDWRGDGSDLRFTHEAGATLRVFNLAPDAATTLVRRGQGEPELAGWVARRATELEPACALTLSAPPARSALLVTFFALGEASEATARLNPRSLAGRVSWRDAAGGRTLSLRRVGWRRALAVELR